MAAGWNTAAALATAGKSSSIIQRVLRCRNAGPHQTSSVKSSTAPTTIIRRKEESCQTKLKASTLSCIHATEEPYNRKLFYTRSTSCPHSSLMTSGVRLLSKCPIQCKLISTRLSTGAVPFQSRSWTRAWYSNTKGVASQKYTLNVLCSRTKSPKRTIDRARPTRSHRNLTIIGRARMNIKCN